MIANNSPGILSNILNDNCLAFYLSKEEVGEFAVMIKYEGRDMFLPIENLRFSGTHEEALDVSDKLSILSPKIVKLCRS